MARNHVAAVSLTTGNLLPWNPNTNGTVRAIKVAGSAVYLGGAFTQVGGVSHLRIAKVAATGAGAVVATWNASATGEVFGLASAGGTIYLGGGFGTVDGNARANLAAVKGADGTILPWNPGTDGQVRAIKFTSATRLVVGGTFTHLAGAATTDLGAVDADTGSSLPWQGHINYPVIGLANDAAGVYVAGAGGGGNFAGFAPATGAPLWQGGTNGNVQAIGVAGGFVYLGGHFQTYCGPQHGQPRARRRSPATSCSRSTRRPAPCRRGIRAQTACSASSPSRGWARTATCWSAATSRAPARRSSRGTRSTPRERRARLRQHLEAPAPGAGASIRLCEPL